MPGIIINGIVAHRDKQPYLQMLVEDRIVVQLTMAEARNIARDIEKMCARTEADAMLHKFFSAHEFPDEARNALMISFREFRSQLDAEIVEKTETDPDV